MRSRKFRSTLHTMQLRHSFKYMLCAENRGIFGLVFNELLYRVAKKSKTLSNKQKITLNRIKACQEIIFIRQIKECIQHYNIIRWH